MFKLCFKPKVASVEVNDDCDWQDVENGQHRDVGVRSDGIQVELPAGDRINCADDCLDSIPKFERGATRVGEDEGREYNFQGANLSANGFTEVQFIKEAEKFPLQNHKHRYYDKIGRCEVPGEGDVVVLGGENGGIATEHEWIPETVEYGKYHEHQYDGSVGQPI